MDQNEYERWMFMLLGTGTILAILEFLVVSLLIGHGSIGGYRNGFLAGAAVVVVVVVLVWLATIVIQPEQSPDKKGPASSQ